MRMIIELRKRFLEKWKGKTNSAAVKADLRHFASVIDFPIELPEAMMGLLVLLVIPPDVSSFNHHNTTLTDMPEATESVSWAQ